LYDEFNEKAEVPLEDLNLYNANHYADSYFCTVFNEKRDELPFQLSPEAEALIPAFLGTEHYKGTYGNDDATRITITPFFNFLSEKLSEKAGDTSLPLKYIYFSAHDTTITGFMSGIEQKQTEIPPYAS
jgi:hypothetical protein